MEEDLIIEVNEVIENLKLEIKTQKEELNSLIIKYQELTGFNLEDYIEE